MTRVEPARNERRAAVTVVGAASLAAWFLLGQLSENSGSDYIFRIPATNRTVEIIAGLTALSAAVWAGFRLSQHGRDWLIGDGWWRVYARLLAAGLLTAIGLRLVTAASNGANIGGGMVTLFGPLAVLYLLARARGEATLLGSPDEPPGWRPSAVEWLATGGGGVGLKTFALLCAGFLMVVLVPGPALIAIGAGAAVAWSIWKLAG